MSLTNVQERFILHWGEMGTRWGINRSVAQIHALLYLSPGALPADQITRTLSIARSNVSTSIRELQAWGLVRTVHVLGDRRDHFEAVSDVWATFERVLEQRKRREIDPTLAVLRDCVAELDSSTADDSHTRSRISKMLEFFETTTAIYEECHKLPLSRAGTIVKLRSQLRTLIPRTKDD